VHEQQLAAEQQASPQNTPTSCPNFEEEDTYPDMDIGTLRGMPIISQDDVEDTSHPAANNQQQRQIRTLTQDYMLHMMEIPGYTTPFTPRQAVSQTFPLQFLCDLAYAVLEDNTGGLLEYRHLIKHPKYKDTWSNSFGKEIRRLATTTETKFSSTKRTFHKTAKVTKLMKELYVSTEKARKTSTAQKSQLGATSSTTPETVVPQLQISSQSSSSSTASDPNPLQNSCPLTSKTSIFALQ
jgi:hypothetical protein